MNIELSEATKAAVRRVKLQVETLTPSELMRVACIDCDWLGLGIQLKAQSCPLCDGRVLNIDDPRGLHQMLKDLVNFEEQINIEGSLTIAESKELGRLAHIADLIICDSNAWGTR